MRTDCFDFILPAELIAQAPISPRDASRLLEILPSCDKDRAVLDLPTLLQPGDLLVLNDTRVIPTRLRAKRGNANIEITLHKPISDASWYAFARPGRRLKVDDTIEITEGFSAKLLEKREGGEIVLKLMAAQGTVIENIYECGELPLPPYIERNNGNVADDDSDYQTIYAKNAGAVAAPTAGLHFTERLFGALKEREIATAFVTLHVGAGTFLPIKTDEIEEHRMHSEFGVLSETTASAINEAKARGGRIVAVGSTSLRTIESAAQENGQVAAFEGETDLFISPGYKFKAVDLFLTNFHLPRSTLFVLVSAFCGTERMKRAYEHAIQQRYRFYSYGDCCLLHRNDVA